MSVVEVQRRPRPTVGEFLCEVAAVVADLPRFATAPLWRGWHRTWGATREEASAAMPADDVVSRAHFECTRAVTVDAPPQGADQGAHCPRSRRHRGTKAMPVRAGPEARIESHQPRRLRGS